MKKEYIYPSVKVYQLRHFGEALMVGASNPPAVYDLGSTSGSSSEGTSEGTNQTKTELDPRTNQPILRGEGDALAPSAGKIEW